MVYLEHSGTKFWRCEKTKAKIVTTSYGKLGSDGRTLTKDFKNKAEAEGYVDSQVATKRKNGYTDATDPNDKKGTKRKKSQPQASKAPPQSKKAGLKNHAAPDTTEAGAIDSGVAGFDAALASRVELDESLHAKLSLVEPSKNSDKYYILQVLADSKKKKGKQGKQSAVGFDYYLFTRWGRTGSGGQAKIDGPLERDAAEDSFCKIFKSKTGLDWHKATPGSAPKKGKYEYLQTSTPGEKGYWWYHLTSDPMGKPDGWYAYDEENSVEVEIVHGEFTDSSNADRLSSRFLHSESSGWTYEVNLKNMIQKNTGTGKVRPIQRTTSANPPVGMSSHKKKSAASPKKKSAASPAAPTPTVTSNAQKMKTSVSSATRSPHTSSATTVAGTVDSFVPPHLQSGSIYGEYDVMLNQTNLCANNNKFYKIQLVQTSAGLHLFTRWGRVGEDGATQELGPMGSDDAVKEFCKKFKSKTSNKYEDRDDFKPKKGKYTMVEMEKDTDAAQAMSSRADALTGATPDAVQSKTLPCELDSITKGLVDLLFSEDMFNSAMTAMNLDPAKLPLGALSTAQIEKGFDALVKLEAEINGSGRQRNLMELTSDFYTIIPHAFGRNRGPVLSTKAMVDGKYEMLNTLTDIEAAQAMQKRNKKKSAESQEAAKIHPSDLNYEQLTADLSLVKKGDSDRKIIECYLANTSGGGGMKLRDIWRVNRHNESTRFAAHSNLSNRRLLWHGTNVAVVAAILKSGLRIMPHSGGRVGSGIYLADQHAKSAWYVQSSRGTVIMFLVEAALGKQHEILMDDSSLKSAPKGFDSVLAKGTHAPPENKDTEIEIDNVSVKVPQGKPAPVKSASTSSFAHNEFLIYKESQHRIRYILTFDG